MTEQERKRNRAKAAKLRAPKPHELPSGQWRCQVMVGGVRHSVVDDDPVLAHSKALALRGGFLTAKNPSKITVQQAIKNYIESKTSILSPSTLYEYKRAARNDFKGIEGKAVSDMTLDTTQRWVNDLAASHAPKTVRNTFALFQAAVKPLTDTRFDAVVLPQKAKVEIVVPTTEEVKALVDAADGYTKTAIMLAAWLGLRRSEILAVTKDCLSGNVLHIKQARVRSISGESVKRPKSYSGDRKIKVPDDIAQMILDSETEAIVPVNASTLAYHFEQTCKKAGVRKMRFHDLRHYSASVLLMLGVPDKYAMERMGHATNNMLKTVYQHTMAEKRNAIDDEVDNYFTSNLHTNCTRSSK